MGKRGPQKGAKYKPTLAKEAARELARQLITEHLRPMVDAQIANALGIKYLVVRDKRTGKFIRMTEHMAKQKQAALGKDEEIIEVWEKDPSVRAFTDLMNRALDKPKEQAFELSVSANEALVARLDRWKARNPVRQVADRGDGDDR